MAGTEEVQELGRRGVYAIKEWLESTTRFAFSFTIYDNKRQCSVDTLDDKFKTFDIEGQVLIDKSPLSVECKKYSSPGAQSNEFRKFLAIAYSSTAHSILKYGTDAKRHFIWVTYHPFDQTKWATLTTVDYLKDAVGKHPEMLNGQDVSLELLAKVHERISLFVVTDKQMDLRLTKAEMLDVRKALGIGV